MLEEGWELGEACKEVAMSFGVPVERVLQDMEPVIQALMQQTLLARVRPASLVTASVDTPKSLYTSTAKADDHASSLQSEARWYHYLTIFVGFLGMRLLVRLPFRWWCTLMRWSRRLQPKPASAGLVRQLLQASYRVNRYFPGRIACLERSLAIFIAGFLLGCAPTWCLGSAFDTVRHHAWLEAEGLPVGEAGRIGTKPFGVHVRI